MKKLIQTQIQVQLVLSMKRCDVRYKSHVIAEASRCHDDIHIRRSSLLPETKPYSSYSNSSNTTEQMSWLNVSVM
jgi:hypothetical protein